ncbi:AAA family ATPase [Acinetobacter rudis]|uniref:AAA family ATPase n=1 Tax=Acinetobacter rudis TaxID=632955 RepID=UPI002810603F|nr:AAA family ATPase [Acinetobacter rudis]MDQ8953760.1 AAA family ATPase [Acinetobacter rudis]
MKILSIKIKNLASLAGEQHIDFDSEPLASAGLIAIVGKTGAGKSSILDAMCLALFNRVPRLKDSDGKITDVDGSELPVNSPLTVLRRGTAHGYAELCFIAQDQKHYAVRWEIKRARENPAGKLQSIQRSLKCLTDGIVLADKAKAVDEYIKKITQLSFEQFTRAVLLAQSEVTAFLKARDNERGELLEYLTNSNIFTKIGELAFRKTKDIAAERKQLEQLIGHIELLTPEQVTELEAQFNSTKLKLQQLEQDKQQLTQQQQWYEQQQKLQLALDEKKQYQAQQQLAQQALTPEHNRLKRIEIFAEIRSQVDQQQQYLHIQQQLSPNITQLHQHFSDIELQYANIQAQYQRAADGFNQRQAFRKQYANELKQVQQCVELRGLISEQYRKLQSKQQQLLQQQKPLQEQSIRCQQQGQQQLEQLEQLHLQLCDTEQFSSLDQGIQAHIQQLEQFIQQYPAIEHHLGPIHQAEQALKQLQLQLEQTINQFGHIEHIEQQLSQSRLQRESQVKQLGQLDFISQQLQQLSKLAQERVQTQNQLDHTVQQLQQQQHATDQAEQLLQQHKTERTQLQDILQQQRLLHSENIEKLRQDLVEGQACLVCGSTEHPYHSNQQALSKTLFELQLQQEQQAEQKEQHSLHAWQQAKQNVVRLQTSQEQYIAQLDQLNAKYQHLSLELRPTAQTLGLQLDLTQPTPQLEQAVQQQRAEYQQSLDQLAQAELCYSQAIKDQNQLQQQIQQQQHQIATAEQLQQQVQHLIACLTETEQQHWQQQVSQSGQLLLERLKQRAQQLQIQQQLRQQHEQLQQQSQLITAQLNQLEQQNQELQLSLQEVADRGQSNTEKAQQLIELMTTIADCKPQEWLEQQQHQDQQQLEQYQLEQKNLETCRLQYEAQKTELAQLKAQANHNQNSLQQVMLYIDQWLKQHQDFNQVELAQLQAVSPAQIQDIRQQLAQADRAFNDATAALNTLYAQCQEHQSNQPSIQYDALITAISQHTAQFAQQREQYDQLKLKQQIYQQNLSKLEQFSADIEQIQQQEYRWSKISALLGDAHGKKFRDLAQQYHLDILIEYANQQLVMLSQRYTLKRLENSLSLAIIDHDMDGETRSVSSLSGGESFLTALALSLAIANMASGSMKIESLFIDEGFGTLDASSLHMVMNALDQLQSQGRKVVLISHIPDMHERIPVQIQVNPCGAGASRIEIVA